MDYSEGLEVMSNDLGEAPHDQGEREGSAGPDRGAPHACMHGWLVLRGKMGLMVSTCMSQGAQGLQIAWRGSGGAWSSIWMCLWGAHLITTLAAT